MFSTIRRHQSWLWPCLAVVVIVTMLGFLSPTSRSTGGILGFFKPKASIYGTIAGQPVTDEQYQNAYTDLVLPILMNGRTRPDPDSAEMKYQIFDQLFLIAKEEQLGVRPTAEAAAKLASQMLRGTSYDDFVEKYLKPAGLTADDFDRYLRHEIGRQQLMILVGMNGTLVTPGEAETLYRSEHRSLATKLVWFGASNYLNAATVTPGAVAQFYSNELAAYSVPDQVQVNYVRYDASNYLAAARTSLTNLDRQVEDLYAQRGASLFPKATNADEAKAMAKKELIQFSAMKLARRDAYEFADELDQRGNHAGDLEKLAPEKGLTVRTTAPFDEESGPTEPGLTNDLPAAFARAAFSLTDDAPFNHDVSSDDSIYVMELKQKFPSRIPPLQEIEAKVTADYRDAEAYQLAAQAATNFTTTVTGELNVNNGVTLPKTFSDICNETGNKVVALPPFSLATTNLPPELEDRVDLSTLKRAGFSTAVGSATTPVNVRGGTFVLYVDKMLPVDESLVKEGITEYLTLLRNARQNDAFKLWLDYQARQDPGAMSRFQELIKNVRESEAATSQSGR